MIMFLFALTAGCLAGMVGFALGAMVTDAYWLAFLLGGVGFIVGTALFEYLINRPGGLRETETTHDPNSPRRPVAEP